MNLSDPKLRKMIQEDIDKCEVHNGAEGSSELYNALIAKYKTLDPKFSDALPKSGKISFGGPFNYTSDIKAIGEKLKLLLMLGEDTHPENSETSHAQNNKVFVVHGHDDAAKQETARVLERLGLEPIILHEQANKGNTIIEKLEEFIDVSYAVVLYTGCDLGRENIDSSHDKERARQNVVFEHGLLTGKLGRSRVCALCKPNIELPGDISGLVYVQMDESGAWKYSLCKELKMAGFNVDSNKLF